MKQWSDANYFFLPIMKVNGYQQYLDTNIVQNIIFYVLRTQQKLKKIIQHEVENNGHFYFWVN